MPLNGHKKIGNYICLLFCPLSSGSQKTYINWLKGKQAQNQQKEEKARIILIG